MPVIGAPRAPCRKRGQHLSLPPSIFCGSTADQATSDAQHKTTQHNQNIRPERNIITGTAHLTNYEPCVREPEQNRLIIEGSTERFSIPTGIQAGGSNNREQTNRLSIAGDNKFKNFHGENLSSIQGPSIISKGKSSSQEKLRTKEQNACNESVSKIIALQGSSV
jgi:hypothetical protein